MFRSLSFLLLASCAGGESVAPPDVVAPPEAVTIALNWFPEPEFGGFYEAKLGGLYDAAHLDVTIQEGGAGSPVIQQVATGRVAYGISTADEVILARAQGADVVVIFATYQHHPQCIMVHQSRGLTALADLKDGTLAIEDGIPYSNYLKKKLDLSGVQIVPYGGGVTQWLLDPKYAQQAYVTSEPLLAKQQGGDPQCLMISETGYDPYADVLVTSKAWIDGHKEQVKAFVAASSAGWQAYLKDGTRANAKMSELNPTLDKTVLEEMWKLQASLVESEETKAKGLGTMDEARFTTLIGQLGEVGALTGTPPAAADCFSNEFIVAPHP